MFGGSHDKADHQALRAVLGAAPNRAGLTPPTFGLRLHTTIDLRMTGYQRQIGYALPRGVSTIPR
jgi:hypothetical protein